MMINPEKFEMVLGGSHVGFKKRERPPFSKEESELKLENERYLGRGIEVLRKLRTRALEEKDPEIRQDILSEAHQFSDQMAEAILKQSLSDKPEEINDSYLEKLQDNENNYAGQDAGSGHGIPSSHPIENLCRAADDMLVRIEEKARSFKAPDHKLTEEELGYVLQEFLSGTNNLTIDAIEKFFKKDTKIGGILSGGSVYVELAKKIVDRYGDSSCSIDSFVIAVDKHKKKAVFETSGSDADTRTVIVADDMIDKGGTMRTALQAAGGEFPNATVYSGVGIDWPGDFEKRRQEEHENYLFGIFQNFAELAESRKNTEALAIFDQAEKYAIENKVKLQAGWYVIKERMNKNK